MVLSASNGWLSMNAGYSFQGDTDHWPGEVLVNGQAALIMNREGLPKIRVDTGSHEISGHFQWTRLPEYILIPPHTGLVSLVLKDESIAFPNLDSNSRLWLQASREQTEKVEDRLTMQCFRLIDDSIPAQMVTLLKLDITGAAREMVLGTIFAPGKIVPLSLSGDLPARLEPDGRMRVQVRPGQWTMKITSRQIGPLTTYTWERPDDTSWPSEEIISFLAHPDLRSVEIEGVSPIVIPSSPPCLRMAHLSRLPHAEQGNHAAQGDTPRRRSASS